MNFTAVFFAEHAAIAPPVPLPPVDLPEDDPPEEDASDPEPLDDGSAAARPEADVDAVTGAVTDGLSPAPLSALPEPHAVKARPVSTMAAAVVAVRARTRMGFSDWIVLEDA
jgi:hypothetical protein